MVIAAGWSAQRQPDDSVSVFACLNADSCPAGISSAEFANWTLPSHSPASCTIGYTGLLCGECAKAGVYNEEGYEMKPDGSCKDCGNTSLWGLLLLIVLFPAGVCCISLFLAAHDCA